MTTPPLTTAPPGVVLGDSLDVLAAMPANSVDAVVTDPPYGLEFLGTGWDQFADADDVTRRSGHSHSGSSAEIVTVAMAKAQRKPTRITYGKRRTTFRCDACGKRDGFRQPHGTDPECIEPSWTPEYVDAGPTEARAFVEWTRRWTAEALRVVKPGGWLVAFGGPRVYHRTGMGVEEGGWELRDQLLWVYGTGYPKSLDVGGHLDGAAPHLADDWRGWGTGLKPTFEPIVLARRLPVGPAHVNIERHGVFPINVDACRNESGRWPSTLLADPEGAAALDAAGMAADAGGAGLSRLAYVAKPTTAERTAGIGDGEELHPTVKPVDLMRWLVRLTTPAGGVVLDPFAGSGTTGIAAHLEDRRFAGVEIDPKFAGMANRRIEWWRRHADPGTATADVVAWGTDADAQAAGGQLDLLGDL